MADEPDIALSVVIPAFNEAARLRPTLASAVAHLSREAEAWEIIVVDDGSTDDTVAIAHESAASDARVQIIELSQNRGKGAAVRAGMLAARGRQVLFCDADEATPMGELARLREKLAAGYDIAIASRALPESDIRTRQHPLRELMGRTFNVMVRIAGLSGIRDTQCGFKLFTRAAAQDLFGRATVDGFAFDVEILVLARGRYRVAEVPVAWRHVEESKVSPGKDAIHMLVDVLRIRLRHHR